MLFRRQRVVRNVGRLTNRLNKIFATIACQLDVGLTTAEIDSVVASEMTSAGVESTFRRLGFPAHCTTSINDEVVNTIPSETALRDGDLLKLQLGAYGFGVYATQGWTFPIGTTSSDDRALVTAAHEALDLAVDQAEAGKRVGDISAAIQTRVESAGYSVNRKMVGNAMGHKPHQEPLIPGYGTVGRGQKLRNGMSLSISVIVHAGDFQAHVLDDDWNMVTTDGKNAVHFSHMVIVRKGASTVLTASHTSNPYAQRAVEPQTL